MWYLLGLRQYLRGGWDFAKQLPTRWKELTLGALVGVLAVMLVRRPVSQPPPLIEVREVVRTVDRIVEVEKWRDREVVKWRDRKVVVTKPDGTRVETTETSGSQSKDRQQEAARVVERRVEKELTVDVPLPPPPPKPYRAGVAVLTAGNGRPLTGDRLMLTGSARLGASPVTLDLHLGTSYKAPTLGNSFAGLGLSVEF